MTNMRYLSLPDLNGRVNNKLPVAYTGRKGGNI